jgi:hypothetical protein
VRLTTAARHMQLLLAINEHGEHRRFNVMDNIQLKPTVVDVVLDKLPVTPSITCSKSVVAVSLPPNTCMMDTPNVPAGT